MTTDSLALVRWQFRMTWSLADDVHLPRVTDELCRWQPRPTSWTVREAADGRWLADWADEDPVDPPPPSIGWLTWHVLWWWSDALSVVRGGAPAKRADVTWPGSAAATVAELRRLAREWRDAIAELSPADAERPVAFPWPDERPLIYTIAWVNSELMKNVAEIGEVANMFTNRNA